MRWLLMIAMVLSVSACKTPDADTELKVLTDNFTRTGIHDQTVFNFRWSSIDTGSLSDGLLGGSNLEFFWRVQVCINQTQGFKCKTVHTTSSYQVRRNSVRNPGMTFAVKGRTINEIAEGLPDKTDRNRYWLSVDLIEDDAADNDLVDWTWDYFENIDAGDVFTVHDRDSGAKAKLQVTPTNEYVIDP